MLVEICPLIFQEHQRLELKNWLMWQQVPSLHTCQIFSPPITENCLHCCWHLNDYRRHANWPTKKCHCGWVIRCRRWYSHVSRLLMTSAHAGCHVRLFVHVYHLLCCCIAVHSYIHAYVTMTLMVAVWCNGSALVSINEFNLRRARLVLGWLTVSRPNSWCRTFVSVCNHRLRSTQPGHLYVFSLFSVVQVSLGLLQLLHAVVI